MGFGGPQNLEAVAPMLERVMGSPPPPSVVASVQEKYAAIGGASPVVPIAQAICKQLQTALQESELAEHVQHVQPGMCFTEPCIQDGLTKLADARCERIICLAMTPYESWAAWDGPAQRVRSEAATLGIDQVLTAPVFGLSDAYVSGHVQHIITALKKLVSSPSFDGKSCEIIFAAHSLPLEDAHETASQYQAQFEQAGKTVVAKLEHFRVQTSFAYTSVGVRGGKWLGPDLDDELVRLATEGVTSVVVCPLGFATDHMEVLYDIDIDAVEKARSLGMNFTRTPTLATIPTTFSDSCQSAPSVIPAFEPGSWRPESCSASAQINPALTNAMMNSIRKVLRDD